MKAWLKPSVIALTAVVALGSTAAIANATDVAQSEHGCMMKGGKHAMTDVKGHHKGHNNGHHKDQAGDIRYMLRGVELTDEQKTQVNDLLKAHQESRKALQGTVTQADISAHHEKMLALMAAPAFDETAAKALIAERRAKGEERALASMKLRHQVYNLLTAEQKAQVDTKLNKKLVKRVERIENRSQQPAQ